ncbi:glutathione S-transferase C-terminal domain-containing protein-like [Haliotis rubra]|uniref:glutathione S-transferase C-terminal domain-containing protein-like n=1 Tax=Haliotis rubra TaxID=36100 RepID=UPI001EE4F22E|nr:glutathione S-transferase C-terminal domain-containing protein-like [Haliotis rubra]
MVAEVYLSGRLKNNSGCAVTLSSSAVLFVVEYCAPVDVRIIFVKDAAAQSEEQIELPLHALQKLHHTFTETELLPLIVQNCQLPVIFDPKIAMVRSGLCCAVRHLVKLADATSPTKHFKDLLGFRQGSLRMCAEVSGWTKLCEVELNKSLTQLIQDIRLVSDTGKSEVELPQDLLKLEAHFLKPPKIHNDDKMRRAVLKEVKEEMGDEKTRSQILKNCTLRRNSFLLVKEKQFPHGNRTFRLVKHFRDINEEKQNVSNKCEKHIHNGSAQITAKGDNSVEDLIKGIESLNYLDVELLHLYSEGIEMTVADLVLFVYLYHVITPHVMKWLGQMVKVEGIQLMVDSCFKVTHLAQALTEVKSAGVLLSLPRMVDVSEDDMELSRRCRSKHKAYKPDVSHVLRKITASGIVPKTGEHLRGSDVTLDWGTMPSAVHPKEGQVPAKRTARKCQQLENLVTSVTAMAQSGDVIVDFCSGGGHLGLAVAYLLPECKVYLIENKEESLVKAIQRIDALKLKNVILYQCNLDYFHGKFDIGVCLHACGSATDMVLQQCLNNSSAFVICPCCYGCIQKTHLMAYPRSQCFVDAFRSSLPTTLPTNGVYKDFLTLGHAADQTEFNIALEEQGRYCSNLVDTDRAELAREQGYSVILCSLQPLTCTPKNNLILGTPNHRSFTVS